MLPAFQQYLLLFLAPSPSSCSISRVGSKAKLFLTHILPLSFSLQRLYQLALSPMLPAWSSRLSQNQTDAFQEFPPSKKTPSSLLQATQLLQPPHSELLDDILACWLTSSHTPSPCRATTQPPKPAFQLFLVPFGHSAAGSGPLYKLLLCPLPTPRSHF